MASDDGFREIQLDGKQLVFLFMATTIVAVVIFLCGVMVGRGVRNGPATVAIEPASGAPPPAEAVEPAGAPGPATANAPAAPPATPPAPPAEDSSYYSQLGGEKPPAGAPKQTPTPVVEQPAAVDTAKQKTAAPPAVSAPAATTSSEPPLVVQVAAMLEKNQAEAIVKRLVAKGYPAYLVEPPATGGMFRVRVGKFNERREAEAVMRRLEKEEQFKPWITR
jgi:cell division septation protein DedD